MTHIADSITDTELVSLLKGGGVGVIPTDTVYGLVCSAADPVAVKRLYALKHREHKPGTVIAAKVQQFIDLGIRPRYVKAVEDFWPNPLSVVIPCDETHAYLHLGKHSLAVRVPSDKMLRSLLLQTGPLVTTSANLPGEPVATNIDEAQKYFGNQIDFYVNGGDIAKPVPSTIIRIVDDAIEIIRPGAVKIDENGRLSQ
ncbi:MAG: L-threonylcarbamoyladenylate synthase [Candidatus Saccharimonadales bacterium]